MLASQIVRAEIESSLAAKIPSALTPIPLIVRATAATGIDAVDQLLEGGLPVGASIQNEFGTEHTAASFMPSAPLSLQHVQWSRR
jgi:hypothetical protein